MFVEKRLWLFFETSGELNIKELPSEISISRDTYGLLLCTVYRAEHFYSIFRLNGDFYEVETLGRKFNKYIGNHLCDTMVYFLK